MFPIKKILFIALFIFLLSPAGAQQQLDRYLLEAGKNNPMLKAKYAEYLAAMEKVDQAGSLEDPLLTFGIFIQPVETRLGPQRANIGASQMFPWFGTLKAKGDAASGRAAVVLEEMEELKAGLYRDIKLTYNEMYFNGRSIGLTRKNIDLLQTLKELARVNFEGGKTGFVNILRIEMEEKELMSRMEYLRDRQTDILTRFRSLMNDDEIVPELPDSLWMENPVQEQEALLDSILEGNPSIARLESARMANDRQLDAVRKSGMPSFTIGLNYTFIDERTDMDPVDNGRNAFLFPQVGVRVPVFRSRYDAMENEIRYMNEGIDRRLEDTENGLKATLQRQLTELSDSRRRYDLYNSLRDLSERSLELIRTEFSTGAADFEELIRMERRLLEYSLEMERARVDMNNAVYQIEYLNGKVS